MNGEVNSDDEISNFSEIYITPPKKSTKVINSSESPTSATTKLSDSKSPLSDENRRNSENINPNVPTIDEEPPAVNGDAGIQTAPSPVTSEPVETEAPIPPESELTPPPPKPSPRNETEASVPPEPEKTPPKKPSPRKQQLVREELSSWGIFAASSKKNTVEFEGYVRSHGNLLTDKEIRQLLDTDKSIAEILNIPDEPVELFAENESEERDGSQEVTREAEEQEARELEAYKQEKRDEWNRNVEKTFPRFVSARELMTLAPRDRANFVTNNDRQVPAVVIFTEQEKKWLRKHEQKPQVVAGGDTKRGKKK